MAIYFRQIRTLNKKRQTITEKVKKQWLNDKNLLERQTSSSK